MLSQGENLGADADITASILEKVKSIDGINHLRLAGAPRFSSFPFNK